MVCAGYALYGSATMVVLSLGPGQGVNGFMYDPVSVHVFLSFLVSNIEILILIMYCCLMEYIQVIFRLA